MKCKELTKKVLIAGLCVLMLGSTPLEAAAAGGTMAKDVLRTSGAGLGVLMGRARTNEEYLAMAEEAKGASWGYTNLGIAHVEKGNLNVRETPSTSGKLVGKMPKDSACEIIETVDGWHKIKSGEVEGYVSADYLLTGPEAIVRAQELVREVARVTANGVNVRDAASLDSGIFTQVPEGEELEYVETQGDWVKVMIDGHEAYISAEYVKVESALGTAITMSELIYGMGVSDVRVDMVEYAKQFLGNPYVWAGTSLTKGVDCSGFTMKIYEKYGVKLPHYSVSQSKMGKKITYDEIQPGDLIFYADSKGTINHVAMYIGGGQVIHASNPKTGIRINKYNYRTPVKYVSILND